MAGRATHARRPSRSPRETKEYQHGGSQLSVFSKLYWREMLQEVIEVLQKPAVAMTLFLVGICFVILASKQVKGIIYLMDYFGMEMQQNQTVNSILGFAVFLLVWLDVVVLLQLKWFVWLVILLLGKVHRLVAELLDEAAATHRDKMINRRRRN